MHFSHPSFLCLRQKWSPPQRWISLPLPRFLQALLVKVWSSQLLLYFGRQKKSQLIPGPANTTIAATSGCWVSTDPVGGTGGHVHQVYCPYETNTAVMPNQASSSSDTSECCPRQRQCSRHWWTCPWRPCGFKWGPWCRKRPWPLFLHLRRVVANHGLAHGHNSVHLHGVALDSSDESAADSDLFFFLISLSSLGIHLAVFFSRPRTSWRILWMMNAHILHIGIWAAESN